MALITEILGSSSDDYLLTLAAASGLTYEASTDVPVESFAAGTQGFLKSVEGAASSLRIDATGSACPSDGTEYCMELWVRANRTANPLPTGTHTSVQTAATGKTLALYFGQAGDGTPGLAVIRWDSSNFGEVGINNTFTTISGRWPNIPWNTWFHIGIRFVRHGSAGRHELYVNGTLISYLKNADTSNTNITWSSQTLTFNLPAWTGVVWNVAGPIRSYNGTTSNWTPYPKNNLYPENSDIAMHLDTFGVLVGIPSWGRDFTATTSGSGTCTHTDYGISGSTPFRGRAVLAGAGQDLTLLQNYEIGELPWNPNGTATIVFSELLVPSSSSLAIKFNVAGQDNTPFLTANISGGKLKNGSTNVLDWDHAKRYALAFHFTKYGNVTTTLIDISSDGAAVQSEVQTAWSAVFASTWATQAFGKLRVEATALQATSTEMGYVDVCKWCSISGGDSIGHSIFTTPNPDTNVSNNVLRQLPYGEERCSLPGGYYPQQENGLHPMCIHIPSGRQGVKFRNWYNSVFQFLSYSRGCRFTFVEGEINDTMAAGITGGDFDQPKLTLPYIASMLELAVNQECQVWLTTILPRGRRIPITGATNATPIVLTCTSHGVTVGGSYRFYVSGVNGNTNANGLKSGVAAPDANSLSLTGVSGNGAFTSSPNAVVEAITPLEKRALEIFNRGIVEACIRFQYRDRIQLSDIAADSRHRSTLYPNNSIFWSDGVHPNLDQTTYLTLVASGTYQWAKRMVELRSPTLSIRNRLSFGKRLAQSLLGR